MRRCNEAKKGNVFIKHKQNIYQQLWRVYPLKDPFQEGNCTGIQSFAAIYHLNSQAKQKITSFASTSEATEENKPTYKVN